MKERTLLLLHPDSCLPRRLVLEFNGDIKILHIHSIEEASETLKKDAIDVVAIDMSFDSPDLRSFIDRIKEGIPIFVISTSSSGNAIPDDLREKVEFNCSTYELSEKVKEALHL
jgi:DNA-binding NarL/FixJ family response regulator